MNDITAVSLEQASGMSYATLIPVTMGELAGEVAQVCNARDLHICLGSKVRFNDWIARRISEYGFKEGQDFYSEKSKNGAGQRGRASTNYSLSVDMAKELAMVERTEAGRNIRRYFIECEKALRQIAPEVAADLLHKALNPQQQFTLKGKVDSKVACLAKARQRAGYKELWSSLKARHQVAQYRDIAQAEFEDACRFVDEYSWEGEWLPKEEKAGTVLDDKQLYNVYFLRAHFKHLNDIFNRYKLYSHFSGIGSRVGAEMIDHFRDGHIAVHELGALEQEFDAVQRRLGINNYRGAGLGLRATA